MHTGENDYYEDKPDDPPAHFWLSNYSLFGCNQ